MPLGELGLAEGVGGPLPSTLSCFVVCQRRYASCESGRHRYESEVAGHRLASGRSRFCLLGVGLSYGISLARWTKGHTSNSKPMENHIIWCFSHWLGTT